MLIITQYRDKCIGCNYCTELAPGRWAMSTRDGKATLVGGKERRGFFTARATDDELESNAAAAAACPVKVIQVKQR